MVNLIKDKIPLAMKKINTIEEALSVFENNAILYSEATETGEYKVVNKSHDTIRKCINFIREQNKMDLLLNFLDHENSSVRLWAAYALLPIYTKKCEKTLKDIRKKDKGIIGGDAELTLKEWKKGNLHRQKSEDH